MWFHFRFFWCKKTKQYKTKTQCNTNENPKNRQSLDMNQKTLVFTSFLFFGTCLFCLVHTRYRLLTKMEEFLFVSLLIQTLLSVVFWTNPDPPYSLRHKIDAIFVKINAITFSSFIILFKPLYLHIRFSAILFFIISLFCFYQSNKYSHESWCCNKHIFWHIWAHIFTSISVSYAFL